jgi:hypothetical protein
MDYQLIYYIDNRTTLEKANDGLLYADESLQDCSVLMLNLLNFNSGRTTSIQGQVFPFWVYMDLCRPWSLVIHPPGRSLLLQHSILPGIPLTYHSSSLS